MLGNDVDPWAEVHMPRVSGLLDLFDERLPINRKERYYTGTVLPMIVASDGFKHFGRFLALCGMPEVALEADPNSTNIQFLAEYGFEESLKSTKSVATVFQTIQTGSKLLSSTRFRGDRHATHGRH